MPSRTSSIDGASPKINCATRHIPNRQRSNLEPLPCPPPLAIPPWLPTSRHPRSAHVAPPRLLPGPDPDQLQPTGPAGPSQDRKLKAPLSATSTACFLHWHSLSSASLPSRRKLITIYLAESGSRLLLCSTCSNASRCFRLCSWPCCLSSLLLFVSRTWPRKPPCSAWHVRNAPLLQVA